MKKFYPKVFLLFVVFFFRLCPHHGYAQHCVWANSAGGEGGEMGAQPTAVVADAAGNVYVTGYYNSDTMDFGINFIVDANITSNNIYFAKYDATGALLWVKSFGGIYSDYAGSMAIDNSGDIYIIGIVGSPSVAFDSISITNPPGETSVYLAKFNSAGGVIWAKSVFSTGSPALPGVSGVTTDLSGNVFITGNYSETITIGTLELVHSPAFGNSVFVAKYDSLGNNIWSISTEGPSNVAPGGIAVDTSGNIFVTGIWEGTKISFDTIILTNTSADNYDFFLVKYNAYGGAVWAKSAGESDHFGGASIGADASGNIYAGGEFSSSAASFDGTIITNSDLTGSTNDIFLIKYNTSGSVIWAKSFGGSGEDYCYSIFVDSPGNVYAGGTFQSTSMIIGIDTLTNIGMFLTKYSSSGSAVWAKDVSTDSGAYVASIYSRGAYDNLYVTGGFNAPTLTLDAHTITDSYSPDAVYMFVAKYDTATAATGIPAIATKTLLSIYPNPATTQLTIQSTNQLINHVAITNLLGQTIYSHNYNTQQIQIDVADLPSGMYFIKVNGSEVRKFVKE